MKASVLLLAGFLLQSTTGSDVLIWDSTKPLRSADFMGDVPRFSTTAAMTYSQIHTSWTFPDRTHVNYTVTSEFDRQKSWMRPSSLDDPDLLGHEQLHFDITEYHARLLRRALSRPLPYNDITPRTAFLRDSIWGECVKWQKKYDDQTSHGTDGEEQHRWNAVIAKYISVLSMYENPVVTVAIVPSSDPAPTKIPAPRDSTLAEPRLK